MALLFLAGFPALQCSPKQLSILSLHVPRGDFGLWLPYSNVGLERQCQRFK